MTNNANLDGLQPLPPSEAFEAFRQFVREFEPIELLSQLTMTFMFNPEGFQGEATDTRRWARWIEFTAGWLFTNPMVPTVLFYTFFFDLMNDLSYRPRFEKSRGEFVEKKVQEYVRRIFPEHMVLMNPAYPNGGEFSDVAVLHDGKILIFQCKAKGLTRNARIGEDFSRLRSDMQAAIRDAFDQALRAREYIRSSPTPSLRVGNVEMRIDGRMITDIYLINVTLMPFLTFATRFENIEEALGLFPEKEYPFSTALGDLDIITQLLNSPAAFLHCVNRRLALERTPFGIDADEMDLLGFYLSQGMYFDVADFAKTTNLYLNGFSDEIDEYVYRKYDAHEGVLPPTTPVLAGFSELIAGIESLSNMHRTDVAVALLDMGGPARKKVVELIEKTKAATRLDRAGHSFSIGGAPEQSRGFSFISAVGERTDEAILTAVHNERVAGVNADGFAVSGEASDEIGASSNDEWPAREVITGLEDCILGKRVEIMLAIDKPAEALHDNFKERIHGFVSWIF